VVILNPIILKTLKTYLDENPEIPKEMQSLVEKLLKIETLPGSSKEGIDKLYDQILEQFISNTDLIEWSKNYVQ
jgi:hypothetical protein